MDYSYIRESFEINSISKSILSIQISPGEYSFVISPAETSQRPDYIYIKRITARESETLISSLESFRGFDLKEFYAIRIIVHEAFFTLIPEAIFDLQDMKTYLNLNHPFRQNCKTLSNRIASAGAVCVFSMDQDLYLLLRDKFQGADFCHSSLPFCNMALSQKADGCFVQCYEKSMELAIVKDQKLKLYNIFEIQGDNDIVYFIMNSFKSTLLNPISSSLHIAGILAKNSEVVSLAGKYIKDIRFYSSQSLIVPETGDFEYPAHYFLNHREILNCEL